MRNQDFCRNPYFIGINSAIRLKFYRVYNQLSRNPYFIGINSAIVEDRFSKW